MALSEILGWGRRRNRQAPATEVAPDAQPIASVPRRGKVRIAGSVLATTPATRAGAPVLEVTVDDGTGRAVAHFTGRQSIPGITTGRTLVLEGMARTEDGALVLRNPSYRLLG